MILVKVLNILGCTVTYGTNPAPYQALRVIIEILNKFCENLPKIIELLRELSYVDDTFGGSDNIEEALEIRDILIKVFSHAKIELGKSSSNDRRLLSGLASVNIIEKAVNSHEVTNTLGLKWSPAVDNFSFVVDNCKFLKTNAATKRMVLSESSMLFDPLGWVSPVTISFKIFMQDLWIDADVSLMLQKEHMRHVYIMYRLLAYLC